MPLNPKSMCLVYMNLLMNKMKSMTNEKSRKRKKMMNQQIRCQKTDAPKKDK